MRAIFGLVVTAMMFAAAIALVWLAPGLSLPGIGVVMATISGIVLIARIIDL